MKLNINSKKMAPKVEELKAHIDRLFYQAQYGREEKAVRFMKAYDYYLARLPAKKDNEVSGFVEPVVRKAVDKVLPSLLNIFTENEEQAVVFRPTSAMVPTPVADAVNKAINDCFLRDNDGYRLMNRAFLEALITGDCFVKVYIEEKTYEDELILEDWTPTDVIMPFLQEYPDTNIEELEMEDRMLDEQSGAIIVVAKGKLDLVRIERKPRIEFVPFTEVYIHGIVDDIRDTDYICHRRTVPISTLLEMGFEEDKVKNLSISTGAASTSPLSTQKLLNMQVFVAEQMDKDVVTTDDKERKVTLYEHYVRTSLLDHKGKSKLYQVFSSGVEILEVNEIERIPFAHGIVEELPGSFWGVSFYDKFAAYQDSLSYSQRAVEHNAKLANFGRYQAVKGAYDRQSMLQNRPGAIVEVDQPGAVTHFEYSQLPQSTMVGRQNVLTSATEDMATSVGFATDAGAINNMAASTMAMAVHNSEMKDKKIAKALAYSLIRPMFELVYNLMRDEDIELQVEGPEGIMPVPCSQLPKRSEFFIDVNTANDDAMQVQQLNSIMMTAMQLAQVPSQVVTPVNQYNIMKEILKRSDIHNVDEFLTDPTPPEPTPEEQQMQAQQQQMQMEQMALANEAAKAQLQLTAAQIARLEVETDELIATNAADRLRDQEKSIIEFKKIELKEKELEAEVAIEAQQGRPVSIG